MKPVDLQKYEALKAHCEKSGYRVIKKTLVEEERKDPEIILVLRQKSGRLKRVDRVPALHS